MGYKCPCHMCTTRVVGCHSYCQAYTQWRTWEKTSKQRQKENSDIVSYTVEQVYKSRKRHKRFGYKPYNNEGRR